MWGTADEDLARDTDKGDYPWVPYSGYFARFRIAGFTDRLFRLIDPAVPGNGDESPTQKHDR
jgi:hypothetical protein